MATILVLHGPNLNLLGQREPEVYGSTTLDEVNRDLEAAAERLGHRLECFQSNAEHELIDRIHRARGTDDLIIINPGGLTHTSVALRDALLAVAIPFIEVHISNVFAREAFRRQSFLSDAAAGVISGLGVQGYRLALEAADRMLRKAG